MHPWEGCIAGPVKGVVMHAHLLISTQAGILLLQSVILGFLTEYFNIEEPTAEDTRNAYLYALGV